MATGISTYLANAWLNSLGNAASFSVTTCYIKLHTADPGANGTTSPATETTRKPISFASAGSVTPGSMTSDADVAWANIVGSEDASHFSLWDDPTAGNFLGSGLITANAYTAGDTYTIPLGSLTLSLTVAA
jgi:hypothetical protein